MDPAPQTLTNRCNRQLRRQLGVLMIGVIDTYRFFLSPLIGQHCRFYPSCSAYARSAITAHGPFRGAWLAVRRLLRCHPWCAGGHDPVPGLATTCAHRAPPPTDTAT